MLKLKTTIKTCHYLLLLLGATSLLLVVGWCLPVMTIRTLVFMRHSFSVLSGIYDLLASGKIALFIIAALFSVILPLVKLGFLFAIVAGYLQHGATSQKYLVLLHDYGRWAMLDVFVVALIVVAVKLGSITSVEIHYGFYIFAAAVLLTMVSTHLTIRLLADSSKRGV